MITQKNPTTKIHVQTILPIYFHLRSVAGIYDSTVTPTLVADSAVDAAYEVVKVPYPATLPDGKKATFGRLRVSEAP